jgi:hypothetical protein
MVQAWYAPTGRGTARRVRDRTPVVRSGEVRPGLPTYGGAGQGPSVARIVTPSRGMSSCGLAQVRHGGAKMRRGPFRPGMEQARRGLVLRDGTPWGTLSCCVARSKQGPVECVLEWPGDARRGPRGLARLGSSKVRHDMISRCSSGHGSPWYRSSLVRRESGVAWWDGVVYGTACYGESRTGREERRWGEVCGALARSALPARVSVWHGPSVIDSGMRWHGSVRSG